MARPSAWQRTLDEARRQALVAVDFYNRPGDRRSFTDFIVHIHLAWQNLLHADRMRRAREIYYRERGNKHFVRNPDGSKKTWDLAKCVKEEFPDNDPVRANIEFFIGLRNHVEHRFQDSVLAVTAAETHACIINFEAELIRRFGVPYSLSNELKFPIFVQALGPEQYETQRKLRHSLPSDVSTFITQFQAGLSADLAADNRFAYRLLLIPMKGPKTDADMALTFIRQDDLTADELDGLLGQQGSVLIAEKYRDAVHPEGSLPKAVAAAVEASIPYHFSVNDFTRLRKRWEIGPTKTRSTSLLPRSDGYCIPVPAFSQFLYTPRMIDEIVAACGSADGFAEAVGHDPVPKSSAENS
ncbi:MAG: DUF3644 domain-containing protein [Propionibacteriaceae bacterium]|nr:DUF3644 domain-containing protein [Propionibacteriaceae bacterium]